MPPAAPTSTKDPLLRTEGINVLEKIRANASKFGATCICPAADHCEYPITYTKGTNYQEVEITSLVQHWNQQESPEKVEMGVWPAL